MKLKHWINIYISSPWPFEVHLQNLVATATHYVLLSVSHKIDHVEYRVIHYSTDLAPWNYSIQRKFERSQIFIMENWFADVREIFYRVADVKCV